MAMVSSKLLFFLSAIVILIAQATTQPDFTYHFCLKAEGSHNLTTISSKDGAKHLLASLPTKGETNNGFFNFTFGQDPGKFFIVGLCRGDLKQDVCYSCIIEAALALQKHCPKDAIGWYDNCTIRRSSRSMLGHMKEAPSFVVWNKKNISDEDGYSIAVKTELEGMISKAASGGSLKFATRTSIAPDHSKIYVLVQCTPDLSEKQCSSCLETIAARIPQCCLGQEGAKYYTPSCNFRYECYRFFDLTAVSLPPPKKKGKKRKNRIAIIIIVTATLALMLLLANICIFLWRKRKDKVENEDPIVVEEITTYDFFQFPLNTIKVATNNFSDMNKLGRGGFGVVYKGTLSNTQEIAVKRLSRNSTQGDVEFKNEVLLVAKLQHHNLVRLLGFCLERDEKLLIYEFVPNRSLDHYIFDPLKRADLDWERCNKIVIGIARGLLYLHEGSRLRIIHRDLKASNILLDTTMDPKISDFGMARLVVLDQTGGNTNKIVGTYGYMAPEYAMYGQFSTKSDVFSFGILLLEIVCGKRISSFCDDEHLLNYAWRNWKKGRTCNLIDPTLQKSDPIAKMMRCIHIALLCVQHNVFDRPNMASIVLMLKSDSMALPLPIEPTSFLQSRIQLATPEQPGINGEVTNNEVSITELYPR